MIEGIGAAPCPSVLGMKLRLAHPRQALHRRTVLPDCIHLLVVPVFFYENNLSSSDKLICCPP